MENRACFDIGGTFVKYGVVTENGDILFKDKFTTPKKNCREVIPAILTEKILKMIDEYGVKACGISTAGQVDPLKGEIIFATEHIPDYTGTKLSSMIKKGTGLPCFVENDVNSAALGEYWMGAAKGYNTFVCLTLGTGIGGAIIIDGKLYRGVMGSAGEAGHMVINENGVDCNCGGRGCYERYASTSAFIRSYAEASGINPDEVNGEKIMNMVNEGDKTACRVYDEFLNHVVAGLIGITHFLDPGLIVIGGGISEQGEPFFNEINKRLKRLLMSSYAGHTSVVQAKLKNDAGLLGACYITLK